jgi:hypothetical protein
MRVDRHGRRGGTPLKRGQTQFWQIAPLRWRWETCVETGHYRIEAWDGAISDLAARAVSEHGPWTWQVANGRWMIADDDIILIVEFDDETPVIVTVYPARPSRDELAA